MERVDTRLTTKELLHASASAGLDGRHVRRGGNLHWYDEGRDLLLAQRRRQMGATRSTPAAGIVAGSGGGLAVVEGTLLRIGAH